MESDVMSALLAALQGIVPGWRQLEIAHIPETSPTVAIAGKGLRGYRFLNEYHGRFSFINIDGSYEDFFKHLSSNFRKQLRKTDKKLLALPDVSTSFLTNGPFDSALDSFLKLEASGWKGKAGSAILSSAELTRFYHRLVHRLAEPGWVEFHFLHSGDAAIASQLAIRMGSSLIVFKIAYNEEYAACSPGNQLFRRCVEREFALGKAERINCLADTAWHRTWRMKTGAFYNVHIYPAGRVANLLKIPARRTWIRLRKSPRLQKWKRALFREATTDRG
jgi:CelD/BcsL family acetyltransferase involved in cellulose biosynthesis